MNAKKEKGMKDGSQTAKRLGLRADPVWSQDWVGDDGGSSPGGPGTRSKEKVWQLKTKPN